LKEFQKSFVKIKLVSVPASCSQLVSRIMAERRAGKYLETWNPSWLDMKPVQELSGQAMADAKKN